MLCSFKTGSRYTALSLLEKSGFVLDGPEDELHSVQQEKRWFRDHKQFLHIH